jgi:hypothetical protein
MFLVAVTFAIVFLYRDTQMLAAPRFGVIVFRMVAYAAILGAAVYLLTGAPGFSSGLLYTWTERRFASSALVLQCAELALGLWLRKFALGRYCWLGCTLPSPAFLIVLVSLSFPLQNALPGIDAAAAVTLMTAGWIAVVAVLVSTLQRFGNPWEDRPFATDFALMTSCTALIFVPFGLG